MSPNNSILGFRDRSLSIFTEAANAAESSEIPPPEEAVKEDVTADGEEKGELDETNNEIAVDSTEDGKGNEQEVVETTDGEEMQRLRRKMGTHRTKEQMEKLLKQQRVSYWKR